MRESLFRQFGKLSRKIFRWTRLVLLFTLFLTVFAIVYFHEVGVPGFVKRPVLKKLHEGGFNLQFSNMRWSWPNRLIIESPAFSGTNNSSLQISGTTAEVSLNLASATKKQIHLESFSFSNGRLVLPLSETNKESLVLTNLQAAIRLSTQDTLRIENLGAQFAGANVQISGVLTNYTAALEWDLFKNQKSTTKKPRKSFLSLFSELWPQFKFASPPELGLKFSGDAADLNSLKAELTVVTKGRTASQWGKADDLRLQANYDKQSAVGPKQITLISGSAAYLQTPYGTGTKLDLRITLSAEATNLFRGDIVLAGKKLAVSWTNNTGTNWARGTDVRWNGYAVCAKDLKVRMASGQLELNEAETTWGDARQLKADFQITQNTNQIPTDLAWEFWKPLTHWNTAWNVDLQDIKRPNLKMKRAHSVGNWKPPQLTIQQLEAELYDGSLKVSGALNVGSREASAKIVSDVDPHKISSLLPEGERWLKKFTWEKPPRVSAEVGAILPTQIAKTNWQAQILPTLHLLGNLAVEGGSYQGVTVSNMQTEFVYSNTTWRIPHLHLVRPEGIVDLNLTFDKHTKENHWIVNSSINPKALRPLIPETAQAIFDKVLIAGPPTIHAEVFERGFDFKNCGLFADVYATNIAYREIKLDRLRTFLTFTNNVLSFFDTAAEDRGKYVRCANAEIDFNTARVSIHEAYSTMEPMAITRAIGRKVAAAIEPYQFHKAPTVYVEGSFVFDQPETADMHFIVEGEEFEWGILKAEKANGKVDWIGTTLSITNIDATAYRGGRFDGWVFVDILARRGNDFKIGIGFTNADFHSGLASLGKTNELEGTLNGRINLTAANTKDLAHWEGFGWLQLQNGFIWDVPIFGIFSPVLNTIVKGSGSSRAGEANATFVITNSIIRSDDLEIRSPAVRVNYHGTVNFDQQVEAKVEAQILRDAGSLGHLFSIALQPLTKIFEYKLSGSLEDPKSEPVFIPKILMNILRPFHSLKRILPEKSESSSGTQQPVAEAKTEP